MLRSASLVFGTKRGWARFSANTFIGFGVVSAAVQLWTAVGGSISQLPHPLRWFLIAAVVSVAWGLFRAWPRRRVSRTFGLPDIVVDVVVGDLFSQEGSIGIGFTDTFDTDTTNDEILSSKSLQGQFQARIYGDDIARLDAAISAGLSGKSTISIETAVSKPKGKFERYALGTVVPIREGGRRYYGIAYSYMGNDLVARATVESLWEGLHKLWDQVIADGRQPISVPIFGPKLAKIDHLHRETLLRIIVLSFVARSRHEIVSEKLTVVIAQADQASINMPEFDAFLKTI